MKSGLILGIGMYIGIVKETGNLMPLFHKPFVRVSKAWSAANMDENFQIKYHLR